MSGQRFANEKKPFDTPGIAMPKDILDEIAEDIRTLEDLTDREREEASTKEMQRVGASALPTEIQIALREDVLELGAITDELHARADNF
jgi:hypothetical protein